MKVKEPGVFPFYCSRYWIKKLCFFCVCFQSCLWFANGKRWSKILLLSKHWQISIEKWFKLALQRSTTRAMLSCPKKPLELQPAIRNLWLSESNATSAEILRCPWTMVVEFRGNPFVKFLMTVSKYNSTSNAFEKQFDLRKTLACSADVGSNSPCAYKRPALSIRPA